MTIGSRKAVRHLFLLSGFGLVVGSMSGCATTITVGSDFPTPLIKPLPVAMGIHYSDTFRHYRHKEEKDQNRNFVIMFGKANTALFDKLFMAMFAETRQVKGHSAPYSELDGIIEPMVMKYAFMLPRQPDGKFYQVWIHYRVRLYSIKGNLITQWPIDAYGKSRAKGLWRSKRLREATTLAMRDAAAQIAVHFKQQPGIGKWLSREHAARREEHATNPPSTGSKASI